MRGGCGDNKAKMIEICYNNKKTNSMDVALDKSVYLGKSHLDEQGLTGGRPLNKSVNGRGTNEKISPIFGYSSYVDSPHVSLVWG